jgi:tetratricopeptide (TPR) repeat protein
MPVSNIPARSLRFSAPARTGAHALAALLFAAGAGFAGAQPQEPSAWRGHLEVLRQEGPSCTAEPPVPFKVPVHAIREEGSLLLWGAMQTARLRGGAPGEPYAIEVLASPGSSGQAMLALSPTGITGEWSERTTGAGCAYALGRLELVPVTGTEAASEQAALGRYLVSLHSARSDVLAALARGQAREPAARLQALAATLPPPGDADQAIAQVFLDAAEHLAALRERAAAAGLAGASTVLYRRVAGGLPEPAALALAANARMARRAGDAAAGTRLLGEALALLTRHHRLDSEAGASVLTQQGNWRRAQGDLSGAVESFGRALLADERRGAPADFRAMALANLGVTLADAGQVGRARQCLEAALALASSDPAATTTLADVIREHLATLARRGEDSRSAT